jgi:hypothetical protein
LVALDEVGATVAVFPGATVAVFPGVGVAVAVGVGVVVGVGVGATAMKLFVNAVVQVTVLPPPFDEPLHWLMVIGKAVAPPVSVHWTRIDAPPPVADPLHWVTVAPVVLATGVQTVVGWVPPPVPEPMH